MTASAGNEGWVERYRRAGYRRFYEKDSAELRPYQHVTIAYGEPDQEAPWLAAGGIAFPRVRDEGRGIFIDFTLDSHGIRHEFDFNVNVVEVLWKGL